MMTVTAKAVNTGGVKFCAESRGHSMFCDIPHPMGGTDTAMTPVEALLGALGNCLGTVIALACGNKGIPFEGLSVEVSADLNEEEHRLDNFKVTVTMPGPVDEAVKRAIFAAEPLCNVHNTLTSGAKVETIIAGA